MKKAERTLGLSFGSSAISVYKTRRFLPLPHGGFGIIGINYSKTPRRDIVNFHHLQLFNLLQAV